jgi:hypothetical protein
MTNLTTNEIELLRAAAGADDGACQSPDDAKMVRALIKQGLLIALPQAEGPSRLIITEAGRAAPALQTASKELVGIGDEAGAVADEVKREEEPTGPEAAPADQTAYGRADGPKGKLGALVSLLKRPEGADVEEMMAATGWQAHSVRGAMSGALKKKLGLTIESEKSAAGRVYRIPAEAAGSR